MWVCLELAICLTCVAYAKKFVNEKRRIPVALFSYFLSCLDVLYWAEAKGDNSRCWAPTIFLPWICNNKAAKGKCHMRIIPDGPAWMNNYFDSGQGKEGKESSSPLYLETLLNEKLCIMTCDKTLRRLWHTDPSVIKRFFLWQNVQENEMIYLSTSVRALPQKDEMGTWGLSVKRVGGGGNVGGLVSCVEFTAVMSGSKESFRNASFSPLCLIIWMTS